MQPLSSSADADLEAGLEMSAIERQDNKVFKGIVWNFNYKEIAILLIKKGSLFSEKETWFPK